MKDYPIDFVVTWVDGNDPVWQAEKAKYSSKSYEQAHFRPLFLFGFQNKPIFAGRFYFIIK